MRFEAPRRSLFRLDRIVLFAFMILSVNAAEAG
jgi:hypothetical protein